jgi:Kef-type K+ transport system membrane component KefB/nucleotide-binding universal stress UspA family protein
MEQLLQSLPQTPSPIVAFTILLLTILIVPSIFERLRLPGLIGLLFAGVVLGSDGLGLLSAESETTRLLSDIGKIYLMFVAGLEIDLAEFRKAKNKSIGFGLATFLIPIIVGTIIGRQFGFGWNAAILIGSLLASHTLLSYPIVQRLGVVRNEAVTVTVGATIFTDIAALLVLAICVSVQGGDFSITTLILQLSALAIYSVLVLVGFDRAGKEYFRRTGDEESNQFLFVLLAVFLASVGAEVINVDKIVGAFLAGLAVNDALGNGPVKEKVEFVGGTLFIPFFFVGTGLILNVPAFVESLTTQLGLTLTIVGGLFASKFLAAFVIRLIYGYSWLETLTMWSLSLPQVAATLAAALVGFEVGLLNEAVFNSVIVLMLATSLAGPLITERVAVKLSVPTLNLANSPRETWWTYEEDGHSRAPDASDGGSPPFTILVPIYNPLTQRYLIEMAALLAQHESGLVVPLSVAKAHVHMDEPQLNGALRQSQRLLKRASEISQKYDVQVEPRIRIDDDVAEGISRAAREAQANLILMGWSETVTGLRAKLFGTVIDSIFWASHCPVAVARLLDDPINLHQVLVPVKDITPQAIRTVRFAQFFADTNQASMTLLHVCDRRTPMDQVTDFETRLSQLLAQGGPQVASTVKTVASDDVAKGILDFAQAFDIVILRSMRRRTAGGLAVSDVTTQVVKSLSCSMILFGEPHT